MKIKFFYEIAVSGCMVEGRVKDPDPEPNLEEKNPDPDPEPNLEEKNPDPDTILEKQLGTESDLSKFTLNDQDSFRKYKKKLHIINTLLQICSIYIHK